RLDRLRIALEDRLYRPVGSVSHPAGQTAGPRRGGDRVAEPHSLHSPADGQLAPDHDDPGYEKQVTDEVYPRSRLRDPLPRPRPPADRGPEGGDPRAARGRRLADSGACYGIVPGGPSSSIPWRAEISASRAGSCSRPSGGSTSSGAGSPTSRTKSSK